MNIIPEPKQVKRTGGSFVLSRIESIQEHPLFEKEIAQFAPLLSARISSSEQAVLRLIQDPAVSHPEGYRLSLAPENICLKASTPAGAYYGLCTLFQCLGQEIPRCEIEDRPEYEWRGFLLDVSRHFFPLSFLKKIIHVLSLYKFNRFQLHLTDDQGWRLEIPSYPLLTEKGAWRTNKLEEENSYGGFYTRREIKELVRFAESRHMELFPEIDLPGHAAAALFAYPELSCNKEIITPAAHWGISDSVLCLAKKETETFIDRVMEETAELFPSAYFHIGGDECPRRSWKNCPSCQALMKKNRWTKEDELQNHFTRSVRSRLEKLGKQVLGWDELCESGEARGTVILNWRDPVYGREAARAGNSVISCLSTKGCYLDYRHSPDPHEMGADPVCTVKDSYFAPTLRDTAPEYAARDKGIQANLWTEYAPFGVNVEYLAFPRALCIAEKAWHSPPASPSRGETNREEGWKKFKEKLSFHRQKLEELNIRSYSGSPE